LFLDEIGDLPQKMQGQLLRVLQEGEVRRVGGSTAIRVDVRVVAATNRDLGHDVSERRLRADLYYRLNVVALRIPSLRERGEDVVALTRQLIARHARTLGRAAPEISPEALEAIRRYPWPGNVRELENALARAVAMAQGAAILPGDLPPLGGGDAAAARSSIDHDWPTLEVLERRYIDKVLTQTAGNKTAAANILGVDRRTLQRQARSEARPEAGTEPEIGTETETGAEAGSERDPTRR
jgi:transcriptional regulator with PAS, ATPase and Fis domain